MAKVTITIVDTDDGHITAKAVSDPPIDVDRDSLLTPAQVAAYNALTVIIDNAVTASEENSN